MVAALRAFGAREPDPSVRNPDSLAERLLTAADLELIGEHPIARAMREDYETGRRNPEVAGMSNLMLVRTRFVDDCMRRALEDGVTQVVILGAGFDTRAYRLQDLLGERKIFEVDYRSTQQIKKRRLEEAFGALPHHVRFVQIDFKHDKLLDVLTHAGYRSGEKTFFIWEGVSMYLPEEAVRETLRMIAGSSASGSSLAMDFAESATIDLLHRFPNLSQHKYTTDWGEPWIFGIPDMREKEFFRENGLELREVFSFFRSEAAKRYLTRADGTRFGSVRGAPPGRRAFATVIRMLWMFLSRSSQWYAVGELTVP